MVRFNNHSCSPPPLVPAEPQGQCAGYARRPVLWNYFHRDSSRLKVAGRRFDHGRCKPLLFHSKHGVPCQIIDQAQVMLPGLSDINVPTLAVLPAEPREGIEERLLVPRAQKHLSLPVAARGPVQTYFVES